MRFLRSPFSQWVMPMRILAVLIVLYGFIRIFSAADAAGIIIAIVGSLVWQAGMFFEMRSSMFQRLQNASVESMMRTHAIVVDNESRVAKLVGQFPATDVDYFFVTEQNGYMSGIVLPEWLNQVSKDEARHLSVALIARPITYSNAMRKHDTALAAFRSMELLRRNYLPVLDLRDRLVGVITRERLAKFSRNPAGLTRLQDTKEHPRPAGSGPLHRVRVFIGGPAAGVQSSWKN
jgi:CBS-domain-containing membrane protein